MDMDMDMYKKNISQIEDVEWLIGKGGGRVEFEKMNALSFSHKYFYGGTTGRGLW